MDDAHYSSDAPGEEEPLCRACHKRLERGHTIQNYYCKPEPIFYGVGPRYLGIELEIDGAGQDDYAARHILRAANALEEHLYIKSDGSLDDGMELVTHPMTLDYHLNQMPWNDVLNEAGALG